MRFSLALEVKISITQEIRLMLKKKLTLKELLHLKEKLDALFSMFPHIESKLKNGIFYQRVLEEINNINSSTSQYSLKLPIRFFDESPSFTNEGHFEKLIKLLEDEKYLKAFNYYIKRINIKKFKSTIDFLLCSIFPEFRKLCFLFYEDDGFPFEMCVSENILSQYDLALCTALEFALSLRNQKTKLNWGTFKKELFNSYEFKPIS